MTTRKSPSNLTAGYRGSLTVDPLAESCVIQRRLAVDLTAPPQVILVSGQKAPLSFFLGERPALRARAFSGWHGLQRRLREISEIRRGELFAKLLQR
jgi:hypothetical protein